jgi:type II secretory pathway component GspD/PulD (secretin)
MAHASIVEPPEEIKTVVSVDLNNVTVEQAIRIVAAAAGVAYRRIGNVYVVAPPDRMAKVLEQYGQQEEIPLQNVAAETAAKQISAAVPFVTARPAGRSVILIGAPEDLQKAADIARQIDIAPEAVENESVSMTLTYAPATDIQSLLTSQFPQIKAQKVGDHTIAFSGPRAEVERAGQFIKGLDRGREANYRYVVYKVKYSSARTLVTTLRTALQAVTVVPGPEPYHIPYTQIQLSTATNLTGSGLSGGGNATGTGGVGGGGGIGGGGTTGGGGGIGGEGSQGGAGIGGQGQGNELIGERTRTLILGGTEDNVQAALKLLQQIDIPPTQVALDVKVVSTSPQTTQNLGIDWSNGGAGTNASVTTQVFERPSAQAADIPGNPFVRDTFGVGNFGRLPISFGATLNAFFRRDDVRVLAKPTITALDNEDGVVFVGETRRVSVSSILNNTGANNVVLNSVVEIPVGIILQMRPRVNEGDLISLHVHPIYSTGGAVDPNTGLFSTFQREADTTVRIRSGETLVIGGMLQDEDTKTLIKVPILGDIPLIGQFFRNHTSTHLRREVLVFVTPHIIKE